LFCLISPRIMTAWATEFPGHSFSERSIHSESRLLRV
jgi:hypothetical protein